MKFAETFGNCPLAFATIFSLAHIFTIIGYFVYIIACHNNTSPFAASVTFSIMSSLGGVLLLAVQMTNPIQFSAIQENHRYVQVSQ